jgi:hypothetical protein
MFIDLVGQISVIAKRQFYYTEWKKGRAGVFSSTPLGRVALTLLVPVPLKCTGESPLCSDLCNEGKYFMMRWSET